MAFGRRLKRTGVFGGFGIKGLVLRLIIKTVLYYILTAIFVSWLGLPAASLAGIFSFVKSVF